ncbi:unnamed protein product [Cladocopium goreaui]|uniref:Ribosomal RNA processing protein 1 homolog B (RRP1-like protein B) n=1 Tax=Cladocopium goreaui TaxID=2562237 RepID=A0A9P1GRS3_9DINO|nr:unnamed protein product [Cladocopium goreaui]
MENSTQEVETKHVPVGFGKLLAHTDRTVRDRGFKKLKKWLQKTPDLGRLEYMKVWKGLYFAMWMADKRPVQQELSVNIALLLNDVPQGRRTMWIECFWDTMRDSWEKLDVHRVNKYMLFLRIVLAEMFKDLRLGGWCIHEVKDRMDILSRSSSHRHNSSSSVGIVMQLTRVLWDELMPQLEQQPKASRQVILTLLEPFVCLAEGSFVEGLVRSIHENILKKCPWELLVPLSNRLLEAAARTDIFQKNREALYEMVDEMEKRAREPAPETLLLDEAENISGANHPTSEAKKPSKRKRTKRLKGDKVKKASSQMSPLMLPKAAEPSVPAFKEHSEHSSKRSPSDLAHQVKRKTKRKVKTAAANASGKSEQDAQKAQEVSFNPLDKVVKYSEDAPVSQMKGSAVKRKRRRLQDLESTPGTDPKQGKKSSKRRKK